LKRKEKIDGKCVELSESKNLVALMPGQCLANEMASELGLTNQTASLIV
jgi:hypothetical protein